MGEINDNDTYEEELLDYEEEDEKAPDSTSTKAADSAKKLGVCWNSQFGILRLSAKTGATSIYCGFWF
ncbi:hypothetical protein CXB51_028214 [Gossypium anomalum]|uniref:Uncharacterized protein n=1 Tax=Gossypium anomalum TaxID=47600 RepID=A0A8J6CPI2_9ROSI|nr:hypothetical protein CXB51_028214 [Gossypium anomalum]